MQIPGKRFGLRSQNLSPKKISDIFSQKIPAALKKFLISFPNLQKAEPSCIFLRKSFHIFQERYIQNSGILRTRSIFGTLADS